MINHAAEKIWEVIVVGGAAAGLTAALYASRRGLSTLVITADLGGQMSITDDIANYPGIDFITGPGLTTAVRNQALKYGATITLDRVLAVTAGAPHQITTTQGHYQARTVILAFGLTPRWLGVEHEATLTGRGVSYEVSAELSPYRDQVVAVVGGGNAAVTAAIRLATVAKTVYVIHRRDEFSAEATLKQQLAQPVNVVIRLASEVVGLRGDERLTGIEVHDIVSDTVETLAVDQLIIHIGYQTNTAWLDGVVTRNERGLIVIDDRCRTSQPGIFAAGDVTTIPYKQIVISAGEGAKAAIAAEQYLAHRPDTDPVIPDWGTK
ncbi:MAG: FAD-dependent oxidoreductase [Patescibacteria group bacterium]